MGDFFNMDNILSGQEVTANDLFGEDVELTELKPVLLKQEETETNENEEKDITTTEIQNATADLLFGDESEEVGSGDDNEEDTDDTNGSDSPDNSNFYSSITNALVDEDVFLLSPEEIEKVTTPEAFKKLILDLITAGIDERNKRIDEALNYHVDLSDIRECESTLNYLSLITPEIISEESQRGETVRKKLIAQSFINKGYSMDKALKMTDKLFANGEDIEEAKEALEDNKNYYNNKYNSIIKEAKEREEKEILKKLKLAENLRNDIMKNNMFDGYEIDKAVRNKIADNILKPTYRDPESGLYYTALQKYEMDNPDDFMKKVGFIFTLTDGFKDFNKLIAPSAKKEVKAALKNLENTLSNSLRISGRVKRVGTTSNNDHKSFWEKGFALDV